MPSAAEIIADGRQARTRGDLAAARSCYAAAAKIYRDQNDLLAYAHTIRHVADMYLEESKLRDAKPLYEESIELYRSSLSTKILDLANALRPYALLNEAQGNLDSASKFWEEARQLYSSLRLEAGLSECDEHLRKLQQL
jgi:tetratricopeptide (TPR) repeat protein